MLDHLIDKPQLQHKGDFTHSHPHPPGGAVSSFGGGGVTHGSGDPRGGPRRKVSGVAPDPDYKKPVLQQGVGDPRTSKAAPSANIGWADVTAAKAADPSFDPWGENRYTGPKPKAASTLDQMTQEHSYKPAPKYDKYGRPITVKTTQLYGTEEEIGSGTALMAPPAQSDLVNEVVADAQPAGVPTQKQLEQDASISDVNASQVAVNGGQSTIAPDAPDYTGQVDTQLGGGEEAWGTREGAAEARADYGERRAFDADISFGQAEGYGARAAVVAPEAVTADVAEVGEWWKQSGAFQEGRKGGKWPMGGEAGEAWTEQQYNAAYSDFKDNFWSAGKHGDMGGAMDSALEEFKTSWAFILVL